MSKTTISLWAVVILAGAVMLTAGGCWCVSPLAGPPPLDLEVPEADQPGASPGEWAAPTAGLYQDYSEDNLNHALGRGEKVVLFFWASYCPDSKTGDADLNENPDRIPENVRVLKVDIDQYPDIKKKYGVDYSGTYVQIGADQNEVMRWQSPGTSGLEFYLK